MSTETKPDDTGSPKATRKKSRKMDEKRLREIEARADAATAGPWYHRSYGEKCYADHVITVFPAEEGDINIPDTGTIELEHWDDERHKFVEDYFSDEEICNTERQAGPHDLIFIAHAREDVPDLIEAVRKLQVEIGIGQDPQMTKLEGAKP